MPEEIAHRTGCVLVAAGTGSRLGAGVPKAFALLAGEPLLAHAVRNVLASGAVSHVVVVAPGDWLVQAEKVVAAATTATPSGPGAGRVSVVVGGAERQDSVAAGLAELPDDVQVVLVHDAARCLAPPSLVARVADAVSAGQRAVVPGLPVADTIKLVRPARAPGGAERVAATVDRDELRIAQTPQGFDRAILAAAHAAARDEAQELALDDDLGAGAVAALVPLYTDDAEMAELVTDVVVVTGDPLAFKITSSQDLAYAEWVLARALTWLPQTGEADHRMRSRGSPVARSRTTSRGEARWRTSSASARPRSGPPSTWAAPGTSRSSTSRPRSGSWRTSSTSTVTPVGTTG